jgi:hypothetical protein
MKSYIFYPEHNSIKTQLSTRFAPHLNPAHPSHLAIQQTHSFFSRFITRHDQYSPPFLLYTLIVTISPLSAKCNILLFQPSPLITSLLQHLSLFTQNPNHTLSTLHSYTQFLTDNRDLISLPSSIHTKL